MCKEWRDAVRSLGKLWSKSKFYLVSHIKVIFQVKVQTPNQLPKYLSFLDSHGIRNTQQITQCQSGEGDGYIKLSQILLQPKVTEQMVKAMVEHKGLEEVNFSQSDLSKVNPNLLASLVEQLERVNLQKTRLTQSHMDILFNRLAKGERGRTGVLKELNLAKNDLSNI